MNKNPVLDVSDTKPDRAGALALQAISLDDLERVRKSAENWRNGLTGLLGLITTVSVVKGRDTFVGLSRGWQYIVGACWLLALSAAAVGLFFAMRAAFGTPRLIAVVDGAVTVRNWRDSEEREAISDMKWSRFLIFTTLALLGLAISVTWFAPGASPAYVTATNVNDKDICGELVKGDNTALTLKLGDGTTKTIPLAQITAFSIIATCP